MQEQDKQRGVYIPEYEEEDKALAKEWAQVSPSKAVQKPKGLLMKLTR